MQNHREEMLREPVPAERKDQSETALQISPRRSSKIARLAVMGALFVAAFLLRAYHIKELPLQFHPIRQYRSAFIARWYYLRVHKSVPEWEKQVAELSRQREGMLEPPILEHLAVLAYRVGGRERLWIPRLFSSIFWLMGGAFLYLLAKSMTSENAATLSTAFFLLLPFGVFASRSFQPDPLMVMMLMISLYAMFLDYDHPSRRRFAAAAVAAASAILIKPMSSFMIFGAFISLAISKYGFRAAMRRRRLWSFAILVLLPNMFFYFYGIASGGRLRSQAEGIFFPQLLLETTYWMGWLDMIDRVVGSTALIAALLGVLMLRERLPRAQLRGLWFGYFIFGLVFNDNIHTHDYYQLQLIPIVALSLAPVADTLLKTMANPLETRRFRRVAGAGVLVLASSLAVGAYLRAIWQPLTSIDRDPVTISQEIGERVGHSTRTLFLSYANGLVLEYHGGLYGIPWPWADDLRVERLWGEPARTVEQRFEEMARTYSPEYFIVTDMDQYQQQPELKDFLAKNFSLLAQDPRYLIFDVRKRLSRAP